MNSHRTETRAQYAPSVWFIGWPKICLWTTKSEELSVNQWKHATHSCIKALKTGHNKSIPTTYVYLNIFLNEVTVHINTGKMNMVNKGLPSDGVDSRGEEFGLAQCWSLDYGRCNLLVIAESFQKPTRYCCQIIFFPNCTRNVLFFPNCKYDTNKHLVAPQG